MTETIFEQMVGTYTVHGDYFLPDITINVYATVVIFVSIVIRQGPI